MQNLATILNSQSAPSHPHFKTEQRIANLKHSLAATTTGQCLPEVQSTQF